MTLEQPTLVVSGGRHTALRPRVRLAVVRGYDKQLEGLRRQLEGELGFRRADQLLVDEAVRAAGGVPGGISSKVDVPLFYDQHADAAASAVLRALLGVTEANLEGTIGDIDAEFLHDFRVSVRRSRAVQRELKAVFPPEELARFRAEFRWLQQATGDSRDLDVYVLEFDSLRAILPEEMRPDLDPLLAVLRAVVSSPAGRWWTRSPPSGRRGCSRTGRRFLEELVARPADGGAGAKRPIGELAGERIRKVYRRMLRMGERDRLRQPARGLPRAAQEGQGAPLPAGAVRAPLYPSEVVKPMIKTLKALQDVLGRHQDLRCRSGCCVARATRSPRGQAAPAR